MKLKTFVLLFATVLGQPLLRAQGPSQDPVLSWMNDIAQQELSERDKAIAQIHTVPEAEQRKKSVREKMLESLAGCRTTTGR